MSKTVVTALIAAFLAVPAVGQDVPPVEPNAVDAPAEVATVEKGADAGDASDAAVIADCNARKFETSVELEKDGKKRLTRMKLCSTAQSDDAAWVRTLEDAKEKIASHPDISAESKVSISEQIDAEIAKVAAKPKQ